MKPRRVLLACIAVSFAALDLLHKSSATTEFHHARTRFVILVMTALIVGLIVFVPRVPSNAASVGAGIACGGALGNLISLLVWSEGVPDPFVVTTAMHGLAFNLADVFALAGDVVLLSAVVVHGMRNRARLRENV